MKHRTWSTTVAEILGTIVAALIIVWSIALALPATVHSPEELHDMAFGWPLAWYHQDLSRFEPAYYPQELNIIGDRADPVPTTVDALPLVLNVLIVAVILWIALALLISVTRRALAKPSGAAAASS